MSLQTRPAAPHSPLPPCRAPQSCFPYSRVSVGDICPLCPSAYLSVTDSLLWTRESKTSGQCQKDFALLRTLLCACAWEAGRVESQGLVLIKVKRNLLLSTMPGVVPGIRRGKIERKIKHDIMLLVPRSPLETIGGNSRDGSLCAVRATAKKLPGSLLSTESDECPDCSVHKNKPKKILEVGSGEGCTTSRLYLMPLIVHLKTD